VTGVHVEASALQAPAGLARRRALLSGPLLRLRSDEQLVALFRAGDEEAFRAIHDRYRPRLFAYTRQMLPGSRQDAEDALQDVFVKAYSGLRAHDRELALRAWLYRVAHNRCIDQLRRPAPLAGDALEAAAATGATDDPIVAAEQREALRRLIADVRRLPDQQRSALLMRELSGMSYAELAAAMALSVAAVKSLLVRARLGLAAAAEARDTACSSIREELAACHDRGVRPTPMARRHLHDCAPCREFRASVRSVSRDLAAFTPVLGPVGLFAKLTGIGFGGSAAAGSGGGAAGGGAAGGGVAALGGGAVAAGGAIGTGSALATGFMTTTAGHMAALLAAAVVTAGGAVEIQPALRPGHHHARSTPSRALAGPRPTAEPLSGSGLPAITVAAPVRAAAVVAAQVAQAVVPAATGGANAPQDNSISGIFAASAGPADPAILPNSNSAPGSAATATGTSSPLSGGGDSTGATGATPGATSGGGTTPAGDGSTTGSSTASGSSAADTSSSGTTGSGSTSGSTSQTSSSSSTSTTSSGGSPSGSGSTTGTGSGSSTGSGGSSSSGSSLAGSASTV
jgi:RNA polymerase sigma factor (sigma-70 family)